MKNKSIVGSLPHIREALSHLIQCWDALNEAEDLLEIEITVDELSTLAVDLDRPEDAECLADVHVTEWLRSMLANVRTVN